VHEHFGKPSVVKGLLHNVHAYDTQASFGRRIVAALITIAIISCICLNVVRLVIGLWPGAFGAAGFSLASSMAYIATVTISWLQLRNWQRRLDAGETPWFLSWHPLFLFSLAIASLVLPGLLTSAHFSIHAPLPAQALATNSIWYPFKVAINWLTPIFHCVVLFWWCDRPPRRFRTVIKTAVLQIAWAWLPIAILSGRSLLSGRLTNLLAHALDLESVRHFSL